MAKLLTVFHVFLYFLFVSVRLGIDLIMLRPLGIAAPPETDESWIYLIESIIMTVKMFLRLSKVAFHPKCIAVSMTLIFLVFPFARLKTTWFYLFVAKAADMQIEKRLHVNDEQLWLLLSKYISWTRSIRKQKHDCYSSAITRRRRVRSRTVSCILAVAILSYMFLRRYQNRSLAAKQWREGFTARIPSCYDGDTCRLRELHYDEQKLPEFFQKMNVRVLGIDAPEIGARAKCDLEECLAVHAKETLEKIVGAGSSEFVSLKDCRFDKYGGRITCDMQRHGLFASVSSEMLQTGFVVPYDGKSRKVHSWCDPNLLTYEQVAVCG